MGPIETFVTADIPVGQRLQYWNDLACSTFSPIVADPADPARFAPQLIRTSVDGIRFGLVHSDPSIVHHGREHVARTRDPLFYLHLQLTGSSLNIQDGREARLTAGDFALFDNTRPYQMNFDEPNDVLVLGISADTMRSYVAYAENVVAVAMPHRNNHNRLLSDFLRRFWVQCRAAGDGGAEGRIVRALLELTASAYAVLPNSGANRPASAASRRVRVLSYIEQHLTEPDLTPTNIARSMGLTPRYLHLLFAGQEETLSRRIMRRRLEESARLLEERAGTTRALGSIATSCGFASLTHFGKAFRGQYGMTPTDYRRRHLQSS